MDEKALVLVRRPFRTRMIGMYQAKAPDIVRNELEELGDSTILNS